MRGITLTPQRFIADLDLWSSTGGPLPDDLGGDYVITTADEAQAVCRALKSPHVYAANSINVPALHGLAVYFQSAEAPGAVKILRAWGLPQLRQHLSDALDDKAPTDLGALSAQIFLLKMLMLYRETGDGDFVVRAARNPRFVNDYLWSVVFEIMGKDHPDSADVVARLRDPLPQNFAGVAYLDLCNELANHNSLSPHPFATPVGISRLAEFLDDRSVENFSYAASATASIPFLGAEARRDLLQRAAAHPDTNVQMEAAWASAKTGDTAGRDRLVAFCRDARYADRAFHYLEELGLQNHAPATTRDPDFMAMAEMSSWLAHPMEVGRPPDALELYDTRELFWPPTRDRRQLWLFHYRYDGEDGPVGIGMAGSVTFALFGETTTDMSPEDIYGLHCAWELEINEDPKAPKERTAFAGRRLLAASNPGFKLS